MVGCIVLFDFIDQCQCDDEIGVWVKFEVQIGLCCELSVYWIDDDEFGVLVLGFLNCWYEVDVGGCGVGFLDDDQF